MTGGFVDDAANESRNEYQKRGCGVGRMLARLDPELRAEVLEVLDNRPEITGAAIHRALLRRMDKPPSGYTIARHRNGICKCEKEEQ